MKMKDNTPTKIDADDYLGGNHVFDPGDRGGESSHEGLSPTAPAPEPLDEDTFQTILDEAVREVLG